MTVQINILSPSFSFNLKDNNPVISGFKSKVQDSDDRADQEAGDRREQSRRSSRSATDETLTDEWRGPLATVTWIAGVGDVCNSTSRDKTNFANASPHRERERPASRYHPEQTGRIQRLRETSGSKRSTLQRHCDFWDRDHDGMIYPWDIYNGFRSLGFNVVLCLWAAVTMSLCSSYSSQTSWLPHPNFAININNIHRCRHGSTTAAYDLDAELDMGRFEAIFRKYARGKDYLTWKTMYDIWAGQCGANDFFGWFAGGLECKNSPGEVNAIAYSGQGLLFTS
jgi:hypothetical protein